MFTEADVERIHAGVRDRTLPKLEWTHQAHCVAAVALLCELGLDGALGVMPGRIRAYNEATGVENSDTDGYHETITRFSLIKIWEAMQARPDLTRAALCAAVVAGPIGKTGYPLEWYSKERLFSVDARRGWIAPDLKPM